MIHLDIHIACYNNWVQHWYGSLWTLRSHSNKRSSFNKWTSLICWLESKMLEFYFLVSSTYFIKFDLMIAPSFSLCWWGSTCHLSSILAITSSVDHILLFELLCSLQLWFFDQIWQSVLRYMISTILEDADYIHLQLPSHRNSIQFNFLNHNKDSRSTSKQNGKIMDNIRSINTTSEQSCLIVVINRQRFNLLSHKL
mgnify:CR=1 FL=1